jgi:formylmethanofuran dehydrogenase subunit D
LLGRVMMKKGDSVKIKSGDNSYSDLVLKVKELGTDRNADWVKLSNGKWYDKSLLKKV